MKLECPSCGQPVAGADIDLARGVGLCRPCGELVPLPPSGAGSPPMGLVLSASQEERRLYKPESLRFVEVAEGGRYEAIIRPNRLLGIPLMAFALFWNGFMVVWYSIAIWQRQWLMAAFGVLHLAVGIGLAYGALVTLLNTRRLVIDRDRLTWRNGPIPTRGSVDVAYELVDGFVARSKASAKATKYFVAMNLADGSMRELDVGATDSISAEYAAACFLEALRTAKQRTQGGPYRG